VDPIIIIGKKAPQFQLTELKGGVISFDGLRGWIIVLNFWSAVCEWCERVDRELVVFEQRWKEKVKVLRIASNANESVDLIERIAQQRNLTTVLLDKHQQVANLYGAATTPHFFVVNTKGILAYQGAWDDITFRQQVATQAYVPNAVEALLQNLTPQINQTSPYGCMLVRYQD
jgi:peroxiredoxin